MPLIGNPVGQCFSGSKLITTYLPMPGQYCRNVKVQRSVELTVVVEGVSQVVLQALNGALALNCCLAGEAHKGSHCQSPVLDLLLPHVIVLQAQGVERHLVQEP